MHHPFLRTATSAGVWALACLMPAVSTAASSASSDPVAELRSQLQQLRSDYEGRLRALEERLQRAEVQQQRASAEGAGPGNSPSTALPANPDQASATLTPNATIQGFNPQVSLILSGTYARLQRDPQTWRLAGFPAGGEIGPGEKGFSLGESEVALSANIDPWFYGTLILAVSPDNEVAAEEAYVQTTALPHGLQLKAGRFYSGIGYLNEQHAHTWDFVDAPLASQAFLGGQLAQEGLQARWLLPTDGYWELGAEVGNGRHFPGQAQGNGAGSASVFLHTGGDVGDSHNWRLGLSHLWTKARERSWDDTDLLDQEITNSFTGRSRLWMLDGVWKWAPNGNATRTNVKLQGEYFRRREHGDVTYDTAEGGVGSTDAYRATQSGWYVQAIYQFMKGWRVGLRHDRLDPGKVDYGSNNDYIGRPDGKPRRTSLMLDWSLSEFSRWRVQWSHDHARPDTGDNQFFLQYQMSLGAHGAHGY